MPGLIDCAVLLPVWRETWLNAWVARHDTADHRLHLHHYELAHDTHGLGCSPPRTEALREASLALRRYDVALLPVSPANLSWARTALANAPYPQRLPVPLLALVRDLKAAAVQDLFDLGIADFVREDASLDDIRVRATRLATMRGHAYDPLAEATAAARSTLRDAGDVSLWSAHGEAQETFRTAKQRVIAHFERHYLTRILMRHAGNISMAARAAQKHRRAFWELMRKHQIDADAYRCDESTKTGHNPPSPR